MTVYRLTETDSVVRIEDGAVIPADPGNTDWQAFQTWVAAGGVPEPHTMTQAVPLEVTKRQAVQALILNGLDEEVEALLAAMPGIEGKLARAEWAESNTVERNRPLVVQMGELLGLTPERMDGLFIQAEGLT